MASLKEVKLKISGVKKTKQITKAMHMVAASRLRGAQTTMDAFRPYAEKFAEVLGNIAGKAGEDVSPLLMPRDAVRDIHVVLCTSDRGLCGGFNSNLIEMAESVIENRSDGYAEFSFTCFGKKGRDWCRKNKYRITDEYLNVVGTKIGFNVASSAGQALINTFLDETYDEVILIYARFASLANQLPEVKQLLPIPVIESDKKELNEKEHVAEHIFEPSPDALLNTMLPRNVFVQIYDALLETSTSEHASRMRAMNNATKACDDMIESLTLAYNKARQAAITTELMDIVGGAEALRG
ncbi:MAG: ATP synthase F1 subunit gamma [Deltaproteobacteria bacterium]|nr:ATP synthase F1 subunit gamma [Deltaproteobacteria bacterium]